MSALEEEILEEIRDLPAERQQEVLRLAQQLKQSRVTKQNRLSIWEEIDTIVKEISPEALDTVPSDGSINVDHYLYGAPKKRVHDVCRQREVEYMSSLEQTMIEKFRALPLEKQQEALEFVSDLEQRGASRRPKVLEEIDEIVNSAPPGTWDDVPTDGSINVDHYLYGSPKKS